MTQALRHEMSANTLSYYEIATQLPPDASVVFRDVGWDEYEELLDQIGEASGLRISYDNGSLEIMTISAEHEKYALFLNRVVSTLGLRLRIDILFFGSATMKQRKRRKGKEPDACFYVQTAPVIGNKVQLDFETDPPPDIAVEIDVHHDSRASFPIYAALGVPEIWRYDGQALTIHRLARGENEVEPAEYVERETSGALPMLTARLLTDVLERMRQEGELKTLLAFDEWLQSRGS
ncbi:MAG TPA: Uma2 family endonuclease [Blastocatellia bacterium]|nr:Uma2 family endonuclease [Blastocatellia bacterium]